MRDRWHVYFIVVGGFIILMLINSFANAGPPWPMQPFNGGGGGMYAKNPVGASANVYSSATNITLSDEHAGAIILMTAAGEVGFPDCSASSIGYFVSVCARDASEQVELVMSGDTTNDIFRLKDATELDANDEADMPTGGNQCVTVMCIENNKWYVLSSDAPCSDGGAAD